MTNRLKIISGSEGLQVLDQQGQPLEGVLGINIYWEPTEKYAMITITDFDIDVEAEEDTSYRLLHKLLGERDE